MTFVQITHVRFSVRNSCYVQNCIMYMYNCRQFIGSTALYADRLSYSFRTHCTPSSSTGDLMGFFILEKKQRRSTARRIWWIVPVEWTRV